MVAERAGVQRNTLYSHFPDEWSLLLACSGTALERDPLPEPAPWRSIPDGRERLRTGLEAIYGWYERNAEQAACVLRDAEAHQPTRKIVEMRFGPRVTAYREILGTGLAPLQRAMLAVALGFPTWRTLVHEAGLTTAEAAEAMVGAVVGAA